ncbi:MAG TPA: single-stranded DNA-binding protein [Polyangiales bacterium]|nr:single-stranded DNA-binding protein [Polyangiales bacterium]
MAEGLNRVILIGNLGQDPELRFTQSQMGVLQLRMATTEVYFDSTTKEKKERTEWHTVVVWGKRGEGLNKVLSKGSRICVEGRLQTRSWEDKQGNKRYSTEINAQNVLLLGGRGEGRGEAGGGGGGGGGGGRGGFDQGPSHDDFGGGEAPNDDDIPF